VYCSSELRGTTRSPAVGMLGFGLLPLRWREM
jgi:hypothetical protein